jgi:hypothetical protein
MKKPFIIFSVFIIIVSVLIYSCGTKDDPAVPNHTSSLSTSNNTISFVTSLATYTFFLGYHKCGDTSLTNHFSMSGEEISSKFIISSIFYDSAAPTAKSTYIIVNPLTTPTLSSGQCYVYVSAPSISPSTDLYVATTGLLNYDPNIINPKAIVSNIPIINTADTTLTAKVSGVWICQ